MQDREEILEELDFGNFVAEKEKDLVSVFTLTEKSKNNIFTSSPPDVVLGPKGSGKSAIFQLLSQNEEYVRDNFEDMFEENDDEILIDSGSGQEDELRKGLTRVDNNVDDFDPEEYWKLYFIIKIALLLEEKGYSPNGRISKLLYVIGKKNSKN
jgi:polynucleotide 5'-kinase involved in rRNA processing